MEFTNYKLTKTWEEVKTINNGKVLEVTFKDANNVKFKGLCLANERNIEYSSTLTSIQINGECRLNEGENKFGKFQNYVLNSKQMSDAGFEVGSRIESLKNQVK